MRIFLRKINGSLTALIGNAGGAFTSAAPPAPTPALFGGMSLMLLVLLIIITATIALSQVAPVAATASVVGSEPGTALALSLPAVMFAGEINELYETRSLMETLQDIRRPIQGFAARFFGTLVTSEAEEITFEVDRKKRYMAPFVHPDVPAAVRGNRGHKVRSFSPAYVKEKTPVRPGAALKRRAGESFAAPLTPQQRLQALVLQIQTDQVEYVDRRVEQMAVESLMTGKTVVVGEGYPVATVDFGRHASLNRASNILTGTARWGQSAAKPLKDLRVWSRTMNGVDGAVVRDVILDAESADAFLDDETVQKRLDVRNIASGALDLTAAAEEGFQFLGEIEGKRIWQYTGWYTNDAGTDVVAFAGGNVLLLGDVAGIQYYGAIRDLDSLEAVPIFQNSFQTPDPSTRWLMVQSAPLPVPRRINASMVASVTTGS